MILIPSTYIFIYFDDYLTHSQHSHTHSQTLIFTLDIAFGFFCLSSDIFWSYNVLKSSKGIIWSHISVEICLYMYLMLHYHSHSRYLFFIIFVIIIISIAIIFQHADMFSPFLFSNDFFLVVRSFLIMVTFAPAKVEGGSQMVGDVCCIIIIIIF